jgi:predicted RNase H-like HicB family nuclease
MNTPHYHINVFWSEEDDSFIADIPDLTHCSAHGDTPEEAMQEVLEAQAAWLAVRIASGEPLPAPEYSAPVEA